jgi:alanyl-tRNA synthetase
VPSNEGRGYVLRRILRRAVRYGRQKLGVKRFEEAAAAAGATVCSEFSGPWKGPNDPFSYVSDFAKRNDSINVIDGAIGTRYVDWSEFEGQRPQVSGEDAFQLYDTYGFPLDLTVLMAKERGLSVDVEGFERCMAEQKERSRAAQAEGAGPGESLDAEAVARLKRLNIKPTDDSHKFHARDIRATVKAIWSGHNFEEHAGATSNVSRRLGLILDKTNHYAEMGGQVTDHGRALVTRERQVGGHHHGGEFRVEEVRAFGGYLVHFGRVVRGEVRVGDDVHLHIDNQRRGRIAANHTATHLLNLALRRVLGGHVEQKGSLVEADRLRFDFSHNKPVSPDELGLIEQIVAERIEQDLEVYADLAPLYVAKGIAGLRAVFGETYPDPVRIVSIGVPVQRLLDAPDNPEWAEYSVEFCGGAHLARTGEARAFALVSETGIAKGVRRVEALTGVAALAAHAAADEAERRLAGAEQRSGSALAEEAAAIAAELDQLALPAARKAALRSRLGGLQERIKAAAKEASRARAAEAQAMARSIGASAQGSGEPIVVAEIDTGGDRAALQAALKTVQDLCPGKAVLLASADTESDKPAVALIAGVPPGLTKLGLKAGDWVRETAQVLGGKGGGRPEQAQGGGPEVGKLREALQTARAAGMRALT